MSEPQEAEHLKLTSSLMKDSRLSDDWDQSAKTRGHEEGITLSATQIPKLYALLGRRDHLCLTEHQKVSFHQQGLRDEGDIITRITHLTAPFE